MTKEDAVKWLIVIFASCIIMSAFLGIVAIWLSSPQMGGTAGIFGGLAFISGMAALFTSLD